jgi:hypothetical protein
MIDYDRRYAVRYARVLRAMSVDQAKQVLGLPPHAFSPTDVQKAYRTKAIENHPDKGGTHERMVDLNVAKDILLGNRREDQHPPVSWKADPEAARRAEEDRKRQVALKIISEGSAAALAAAELAIKGTDLIGWRLNLATFLDHEYREVLDKIHESIEAHEMNPDLKKAMGLTHMLTGMSHRLSVRFMKILKMGGEAHAAMLGFGGEPLTWLFVTRIYFEVKKFIEAYYEFEKMDGNLQSLIVTSESVPMEWDDLRHHVRSVITSFRSDFQKFSDHALMQFARVMEKASKATMEAAAPYGFSHHGDWKTWGVPGDFEVAKKAVLSSSN